MSDKGVSVQVGPGLPALLTVLFVALKLTGTIHWSWVWVVSPLWISAAAGLCFMLLVIVAAWGSK